MRTARCEAGLTQQQVSEKVGRKQQTIGHWETGDAQPDIGTLIQLCDLYGRTLDQILGTGRKREHRFTRKDAKLLRALRSLDKDTQQAIERIIQELSVCQKKDAADGSG